ncbi:MAG: PIG-L family deacetylase [Victivallaceae bacterium]|nr:PIG-L family deacetylase [Victivallaceae bacterium]
MGSAPDDFDAIAVTLKLFHDNGNHIELAVVSGAASGVEDAFCEKHPGESKAAIREREQLASCAFFGLPETAVTFLHMKEDAEGAPEESWENIQILRNYIRNIKPDIVFMPHWNDTNAGHRRTYSMFREIAGNFTVYLNRDAKTRKMREDIYTPFGEDEAKWKAELLRHHESQHQRNLNTRGHGFDERVLRVNRRIAAESGCAAPCAEVFEIN